MPRPLRETPPPRSSRQGNRQAPRCARSTPRPVRKRRWALARQRLGIARRALDDTTVRATHPGRVVGLTVQSGEMVIPSQTLFTLVTNDEWYAVGNFRETQLKAIKVGDCATAYSLIDRSKPIRGRCPGHRRRACSIRKGSIFRESVPYVERSLNWVRVAQRFPVRVRLQNPPAGLMRLGASAVIEVKSGPGCR
jgi:multidrug efflux system membrane fusion protein